MNHNEMDVSERPVCRPCPDIDKVFEMPVKAVSESEPFNACRFLEERQLLRTDLWDLFVGQFITRPDAADLGWRGEYWGKMMRAGCMVYAVTGSQRLYDVLRDSVEKLLATADPDGRISSYPRDHEFGGWDMWCRKYVLLGCEYFHDICRDDLLKQRIITAMKAHLDYIIARIGEEPGKKSIFDTSGWWGAINSCSILEPVLRLYNMTGIARYLSFAEYIIGTGGCRDGSVLEAAWSDDIMPYRYPVVKAYETMSFFEGIAEYYRIVRDEKYLRAVVRFTDAVLKTDYTVIGNCGCTHELFDHSSVRQADPGDGIMQETCVAVTLSKLLYRVFCLTGDPRYLDAMERTWYNCLLGSVNFAGNTKLGPDPSLGSRMDCSASADFIRRIGGLAFDSYSPLYKSRRGRAVGGYKEMAGNTAYGCCACIGAAGIALLPMCCLMAAQDGISVNHYMDGVFSVNAPDGTGIRIAIQTQYPYDGAVDLSLEAEKETSYRLHLRIPGWSGARITVDSQTCQSDAGRFFSTELTGNSHHITLRFDVSAAVTELSNRISVSRGCIVYAVDNRIEESCAGVSSAIVHEEPAAVGFDHRSAVAFTFDNHTERIMVDYASAGSDWDHEERRVSVWLDKE